jgi:hypothetical protein
MERRKSPQVAGDEATDEFHIQVSAFARWAPAALSAATVSTRGDGIFEFIVAAGVYNDL